MIRAIVRNQPFAVTMFVSTLFHLSMISVFSIVLYFPRKDVDYYSVQLVRQERVQVDAVQTAESDKTVTKASPTAKPSLRIASPEQILGDTEKDTDLLASGAGATGWEVLPSIEFPRLPFTALDRLRTREESLRIRAEFGTLFEQKPQDSWAWFTGQLRGLGSAITGFGPSQEPGLLSESEQPRKVGSPAPGFAVYIKWMSEPGNRELLFSPPVQALWSVDPSAFTRPVVVAFTVNPQGKVIDVQIPIEDEEGVVAEIGSALLKYRFNILEGPGARNQHGTLIVAAEQAEE